jgi:hypothetical protein
MANLKAMKAWSNLSMTCALTLVAAGWVSSRSRRLTAAAIWAAPRGLTSASSPLGNSALNAGPVVVLLSTVWAESATSRITFSRAFSEKRTTTRGAPIASSASTRAAAAACKSSFAG